MSSDTSREPLQNKVAAVVGVAKAWRIVATDSVGNELILDSLNWELRLDYGTRTDGQPIYMGFANPGTATGTATWLIQKFTYNASSFMTRREVATASWDGRVAAF